ncbi:NAD-dependent epimerase/dehydratase family protein [Marinomonas mediterranea]|uniref:NAD-dependent epimerase/dehydratase family protein n=1 Tax=Marinomonas mediterranea TaxID=119864 RepID=UPI00234B0DF6|nr:NAD-dependent epimerase/dehydratase family protein [Marinomonas mediterranea]WCN10275.1 NAD-dependent epimerase/dehydratase family protein [Marinomonas mediterranea]
MNILITGANGFVGSALVKALSKNKNNSLTLLDTAFSNVQRRSEEGIRFVEGSFSSEMVRQEFLKDGSDVLFHLASVPGGAAEKNPDLSKAINLDATLSLFDEVAMKSPQSRLVFSSSIAVLGQDLPQQVTDDTPVSPALTYGAHKAMAELALADMNRRKLLNAVSVRLPGIVARPLSNSGLKSAFMSDVFHALKKRASFVSPVSPNATLWIMSVQQCVANLIQASSINSDNLALKNAITLPAIRCSMVELMEEINTQLNNQSNVVTYEPDDELERAFGSYPKLETLLADSIGLKHNGTLKNLVNDVLENL